MVVFVNTKNNTDALRAINIARLHLKMTAIEMRKKNNII